MDRKTFLTTISSLIPFIPGAVAGNPFVSAPKKKDFDCQDFPIIDTHQHLVDFKRFGKDWANPPVSGAFGIDQYKEAAAGLKIQKAVYMEVAVPVNRRLEERQYVIGLCNDGTTPTVGAVMPADLYQEQFKDYIDQLCQSPCIKGIRAGFKSHQDLTDKQMIDNIQYVGKKGLCFDFIVPPSWYLAMADLIKSCPDTRFQADHCANADPKAFFAPGRSAAQTDHTLSEWKEGVRVMAEHSNVVCKISGLVSRLQGFEVNADNVAPVIFQCQKIFGPDRILFASDWPWCLKGASLKEWVRILCEVVRDYPESEKRKLFYDNAARHYKI